MLHVFNYVCVNCGDKIEMEPEYSVGQCRCGGQYQQAGESYDQEFVEQEQYNQRQDREYEERHRRDF